MQWFENYQRIQKNGKVEKQKKMNELKTNIFLKYDYDPSEIDFILKKPMTPEEWSRQNPYKALFLYDNSRVIVHRGTPVVRVYGVMRDPEKTISDNTSQFNFYRKWFIVDFNCIALYRENENDVIFESGIGRKFKVPDFYFSDVENSEYCNYLEHKTEIFEKNNKNMKGFVYN